MRDAPETVAAVAMEAHSYSKDSVQGPETGEVMTVVSRWVLRDIACWTTEAAQTSSGAVSQL